MELPESENTENKNSLNEWKDAVISLAAFATAKGGTVHFGISPEGKRVGVQIGKNTLENLANDIKRYSDPPIYPSIHVDGQESSAVIIVSVEESPIKPVWAFGKPYKRVGRTNQALSREETQRLVEMTTGRTWDALPCDGLKVEHLSREAIEDFLKRASQDATTPTETVLDNLSLRLKDGSLSNAAALLFAKNLGQHIIGASLQCGRFYGDSPIEFIDEITLEGSLFEQLEKALDFVRRNTRQAIKITGSPQHERVPEYPDAAVREAITNAICHRDYAASGNVQVRIFESGMEVWNPAVLPHDLSIESLYSVHPSRPRNRLVASVFHRAGLIERWGTGTLRILKACEERSMKRPEFRNEMGVFIVRFTSKQPEAPQSVQVELNLRQQKALEHIREHGSITSSKYEKLFKVKKRQAQKDLSQLVDLNILKIQGVGRSSKYVVRD